jgi:uncharacterized protein YkwD
MTPRRLTSSLAILGAALALAAPGSALAGAHKGCANAVTPVTAAPSAAIRLAVVCLVDGQRRERGLPPLAASTPLDRSAQAWTQTMVGDREFSHGYNFAARITQAGLRWSQAGENIASGFATPAQVVAAWMASTGHCQNILDPGYSEIGVGVVSRPVAGAASGAATWTTDFALPAGATPPSRNTAPMRGCPYTA